MDHGYEHGELDDDIIADNEEVSDVQEISDDEELSDEIESLNNEEVSGEDTSDDDERSDESPPVENDEISDDEMSDDDDLYNESTNNEIMSQIESDDPNIAILMVGGSFYPPDGDWAGLGRAISRNTQLKAILCVSSRSLMKEYRNDLFRGLASNQYIQNLTFSNDRSDHDNIDDDEVANILANGILRNAPLKDLDISGAADVSHIGWLEIFAALQMNPNCRLEELNLDFNNINEAAVHSLSNMILRHTTTLKTLNLMRSIDDITIAGWGALFHPLQDPHIRLENLCLRGNSITDEVAAALRNVLTNNSRLRELDLSWIQHVTIAGWQALFRPLLQNPNSVLVKLELSDSHITDEVAAALTIALANNSRLRELNLCHNPGVTATGWVGFSVVLRYPNTALEKLDLCFNHLNDHVITSFADALVNNNMLRDLNLQLENLENVSYDGYAAFTHTLCNNASILSTYQSNHSLVKLSYNVRSLPENLISLLRINRENSTSQAARIKIIKTHFSGSDINTQVFADMEVHVRPTAIAWMGRDGGSDGNGDLLFAFLRSMPLLCDTKSKS